MVASISPLRHKLTEAAEGLAISGQEAPADMVDCPTKARPSRPGLHVTTVGWFSDRKRIPAHSGIRVARFQVWQELLAGVECDLAPLHATVTLELSNEWCSGLSRPNGVISIENSRSEDMLEAGLMLHHASYGLESAHPAITRQLQFVMSPTLVHAKLDANEIVRGLAQMKFWNRKVTIVLPETSIVLIR